MPPDDGPLRWDRRVSQISNPLHRRIVGTVPWHLAPGRLGVAVALMFVAFATVWILAAFHDQFWWPPDDGAYAHVASRMLAGEVLHKDVQDVHAGFINFVNAGALALFGHKLVSLRYPLALLTLIQACLVFALLLPRGTAVAVAGALGMTALTFVQFLNPTAHWYALFVFVALLAVLQWMPRDGGSRLVAVGFLLMTLFLFRQLSGVLVAIGALTYLLCEAPAAASRARGARDLVLARALLAIMAIGLSGYLATKADASAFAMFGLAPLAIIAWAWCHASRGNGEVASLLLRLAAGGLLPLLPLAAYHLANGSFHDWIDDTTLAAVSLTTLSFFQDAKFVRLLLIAVSKMLVPSSAAAPVNGLYWTVLLLLAPALGLLTLRGLLREGVVAGARPFLLPLLATFYALVAVHYQIPIYLIYTVGVTLAGFLWLTTARPGVGRGLAVGLAAFLCAVGLYYHAGQPLSRTLAQIAAGERDGSAGPSGIERAGLRLAAQDAAVYRDLLDLIRRETPEDGSILALPVNPELYFLSGRRNPTRFYNSALGIRSDGDLQAVLETLRRAPPGLVFFRPDDKYVTEQARRIMAFVRAHYEPLALRAGFEIYRYPKAPPGGVGRKRGTT